MERQVDGQVIWLRGSFDHRGRANASRRLLETLDRVGSNDALVVDDAHWLPDNVVERIIDLTDRLPICVARSTWPDNAALRELDHALTVHDEAERLRALDADSLEPVLEALLADESVDRNTLLNLTGGSIGLVRLVVDNDLPLTTDGFDLSPDVIDAIVRRARSSGSDVLTAAQIMTLGADLSTAAQLVENEQVATSTTPEPRDLDRRLRASGLMVGDGLVAVVATAIAVDMTENERSRATAMLTSEIDTLDPTDRARLIHRSGETHRPDERAAAAVFLGTDNAAKSIASLADLTSPTAARSAFILDMRSMRWDRASERPLGEGDEQAVLADLASVLGGAQPPTLIDGSTGRSVAGQILVDLHCLIRAFAGGEDAQVCELGTRVVDDAVSARIDIGSGWSPAALAGALITAVGRPDTARHVLRKAIDADLAGPGEQPAHHLLAAHADVACGDFSAALDLVRAGPRPEWQHRDHFLLASLDAAIARRSGDTTRLRDAWRRAAPIVDRQSLTWLLLEPAVEVLAAGSRVGDTTSIERARVLLTEQLSRWGLDGPAPAMLAWTDIQVAVAAEDWSSVESAAACLAATTSPDARSVARRRAASVWSMVAGRLGTTNAGDDPATPDGLEQTVDALVAVGDAWEASRLLGQIALDHPDPAMARSLLEQARLLVSDPVEAADGLIAAGLSEREADVARLVAEGRTYKAIGAQLFISAKTVEHHVARIRQRLGAASRAELLTMIRELAGDP